MRVFILCTGRCGSTTIIKACKHIKNYSAGHETLSKQIGSARFEYPDNHIEADNRLSWFLGSLNGQFGNNAIYIHLIRNKEETVNSFNKRWKTGVSIIKAFAEGILMRPISQLNDIEKKAICAHYYETVNANIEHFLKDKDKKLIIRLENIKEDFLSFWHLIAAEGSIDQALNEFDILYNKSEE